MLEGCSQCCVTFVRIVLSCRVDMHIIPGPAAGLHEGNESFPFQYDILGYVYIHGNDRVTKLYVISGHASPVFHVDFVPRLV